MAGTERTLRSFDVCRPGDEIFLLNTNDTHFEALLPKRLDDWEPFWKIMNAMKP